MILCNLHSQVNPFVTSVFFLIKSKKKNMKKLAVKNIFVLYIQGCQLGYSTREDNKSDKFDSRKSKTFKICYIKY